MMMDQSKIEITGTQEDPMSDTAIIALVNDTYNDYKHGRIPFERLWYKSAHFLIGNHWIAWNTLDNQWKKKKLPPYVPTPVTNKYASSGQRLVSVLSRIEPNWNFVPASDSSQDIQSADQCDIAKDVICEENHIESIRARVSPWVSYTGNCYLLSGVEGEYEDPLPDEAMLAMMNGTEAAPKLVNGKLFTDVLSPYEVYLDQTVENFDDQQKILIINRRSKEYVKTMWGQEVEDFDQDSKLNYLESLGYICPDAYSTGYVHGRQKVRRAIVKRIYCKVSDKYPEGLYAVVCGEKVLEKGVLPKTSQSTPKPFIPISHIKFDSVPGAAFGRTPMDDVVYKNIQRNKLESFCELIIHRMASPIWLVPQGTTITGMMGEPGAQYNFTQVGDRSTKPERIPGEQIPSSVIQFIALIDKDIEDLVSTFEALKGQAPYSGAPNIAIENLIEQGLTRFGPSLRNIAEGYRKWMVHQLEFFRQYGMLDRTIAKKGDGSTKWKVDTFRGADIVGAVNVKIESDSTIPRSQNVEVNKILGAINIRLLDISNPNVKYNVLTALKLQKLDDTNLDSMAAVKENEVMLSGGTASVTPMVDNHPVHIFQHKKAWQSTEDQNIRQLIAQHIVQHNMLMDAEQNPGMPIPPEGQASPYQNNVTKTSLEQINPAKPETPPVKNIEGVQ